MALTLNGLQPVNFCGKECMPKIDAELRLRLQNIKLYNAEADDILASAFPNDSIYVKEFLTDRMTVYEKQTLHLYLLGGDQMLDTVREQIKSELKSNG